MTNMVEQNLVEIFTDGACSGNPGPGGWGAVLLFGRLEKEIKGGEQYTTNNRMELKAAIEALKELRHPSSVKIYTDSIYLRDGITKWIIKWRANQWRTANKRPVKNVDLWRELLAVVEQQQQVEWIWVKGHAGNKHNERADSLARQGAGGVD